MSRPRIWTEEYSRAYMQRRFEELGRVPTRGDVPSSASQQIPKMLGVRTFAEAQVACGFEPTGRITPKKAAPPPKGPRIVGGVNLTAERKASEERRRKRLAANPPHVQTEPRNLGRGGVARRADRYDDFVPPANLVRGKEQWAAA